MVATTTTIKTPTEAAATTTSKTTSPITEAPSKAGEQLVSAVKQGQKVALDIAKALAKVTPSIPTPQLLKIEGAPELPDFQAITTSGFDVAIALLTVQRNFTANLAAALAPAKAV